MLDNEDANTRETPHAQNETDSSLMVNVSNVIESGNPEGATLIAYKRNKMLFLKDTLKQVMASGSANTALSLFISGFMGFDDENGKSSKPSAIDQVFSVADMAFAGGGIGAIIARAGILIRVIL